MPGWFGRRSRNFKIAVTTIAVVWLLIVTVGVVVEVVSTIGDDNSSHERVGRSYERTTDGDGRKDQDDDGDDNVTTCTRAAHRAHEWKLEILAALDRPDTYKLESAWRDVTTGMVDAGDDRLLAAVLRESYVSDYEGGGDDRNVEVVGYNFSTENIYGTRMRLRTLGALTPAPECRLLEVFVLDGWF